MISVLTAPRPGGLSYLQETLTDLDREGAAAETEKYIFVDGQYVPEGPDGWKVLPFHGGHGCRFMWWRIIRFAWETGAPYLLYFEDDVLPCKNAVTKMMELEIPDHMAFFSFFCARPAKLQEKCGIVERPLRVGLRFWYNQAVKLPARTISYLAQRQPFNFMEHNINMSDVALGRTLINSPWNSYGVVVPNLFEHKGQFSACQRKVRPRLVSRTFRGKDFDAMSMPQQMEFFRRLTA